jgi:hypothetical protein
MSIKVEFSSELNSLSSVRRRKFGSHDNLAHTWAQWSIEEGESADGRMFFRRGSLFSYGTHYEIARFVGYVTIKAGEKVEMRRVILVNSDVYSKSTAKHKSIMYRATSDRDFLLHVSSLTGNKCGSVRTVNDIARRVATFGALHYMNNDNAPEIARVILSSMLGIKTTSVESLIKLHERNLTKERMQHEADEIRQALEILRDPAAKRLNIAETVASLPEVTGMHEAGLRASTCERMALAIHRARKVVKACGKHARVLNASNGLERMYRDAAKACHARRQALLDAEELHRFRHDLANMAFSSRRSDSNGFGSTWMFGRAERLGFYKTHPRAMRAIQSAFARVILFRNEIHATVKASSPDAENVVHRRRMAEINGRRPDMTAEAWINGAAGAFYQSSPTLVRRRGDNLETSRGAVAPFREAVAIYRLARQCRASGTAWHAGRENMRAGHFTLSAIDVAGNITIGCHFIEFAEMERLAVREVPHLAAPCFGLPMVA